VARIARSAFPRAYGSTVARVVIEAVLDQTYSIEALRRCIAARRHDGHFLVAECEGAVVGYLDFEDRGGDPELHRIYVDPDLTGQGIGKRLLHELHGRLGPQAPYLLLVFEGNTGARRFYAREGFEEFDRVDAREFCPEHMGVTFGPDTPKVRCVVLQRTAGRRDSTTVNRPSINEPRPMEAQDESH
jgi:GNAT superfamily N-acetyltransferase